MSDARHAQFVQFFLAQVGEVAAVDLVLDESRDVLLEPQATQPLADLSDRPRRHWLRGDETRRVVARVRSGGRRRRGFARFARGRRRFLRLRRDFRRGSELDLGEHQVAAVVLPGRMIGRRPRLALAQNVQVHVAAGRWFGTGRLGVVGHGDADVGSLLGRHVGKAGNNRHGFDVRLAVQKLRVARSDLVHARVRRAVRRHGRGDAGGSGICRRFGFSCN